MEKIMCDIKKCETITSEAIASEAITWGVITCDVIRDLLPLYCDDVCSQDSRELVKKHLEDCPGCSGLFQKMKKEYAFSDDGDAEEQAHAMIVKDMAANWRKSVRRSFIKGALIMLCLCLGTAGGWLALTRLIMVRVPIDRMEIAVEEVREEYVEISLKTNDGKKVSSCSAHVTADGKYYIIVERGIIAVENGSGENWESTLTISKNGWLESREYMPVTEIYYGTGKDSVLIWEEGR